MPHQQIEKHQHGVFGVIGELSFDSVVHVEQEGFEALGKADTQVVFDLSGVTQCSSAALALLLSWLRKAQALDVDLRFKSPPEQLVSLINSAQLNELIPLVT